MTSELSKQNFRERSRFSVPKSKRVLGLVGNVVVLKEIRVILVNLQKLSLEGGLVTRIKDNYK